MTKLTPTSQQGPDNGSPTCISGRIVAAAWWVFCLLVIIMYTANLTANLTVSNMKKPIESLQSLLEQSEYQFGTVKGSSLVAARTRDLNKNVIS